MNSKEVCTMGCELWVKYTEEGMMKSTTYFEGAFKILHCDHLGEKCPFKSPLECEKYQKVMSE